MRGPFNPQTTRRVTERKSDRRKEEPLELRSNALVVIHARSCTIRVNRSCEWKRVEVEEGLIRRKGGGGLGGGGPRFRAESVKRDQNRLRVMSNSMDAVDFAHQEGKDRREKVERRDIQKPR